MLRNDYYTLLGVPRNASSKDIKQAYYRRVLQCHPDLNPTLPNAEEQLRRVIEAYKALAGDPSCAHYGRVQDLFSAHRHTEAVARPVPRAVAERRTAAIKALFVTVTLAAIILYIGLTCTVRPTSSEWRPASAGIDQSRPTWVEAGQNYQWGLRSWQQELDCRPTGRFTGSGFAVIRTGTDASDSHCDDSSFVFWRRAAISPSPAVHYSLPLGRSATKS